MDYPKMRRLCLNILYFGLSFLLAGYSVFSCASGLAYEVTSPNNYIKSSGQWMVNPAGPLANISSDLSVYNGNQNLNYFSGNQPRSIAIPETIKVNPALLGNLAIPFLQKLGPLGKAASLALTVCSLTSLCYDNSGTLTKNIPSSSGASSDAQTDLNKCIAQNNVGWVCSLQTNATNSIVILTRSSDNLVIYFDNISWPNSTVSASVAPATVDDISNATNQLNTLATPDQVTVANNLASSGSPLPVLPPVLSPADALPITSQTVTRDATGTATGTTTTTENTHAEPVPNTQTVNLMTTTTITNTDTSNVVTSSSTTTTNPAPQQPPTDITIDDVPDVPLPTQDINPAFTSTSFGEGTCPGDPSVSYLGHSFTLPFHTVCTAMGIVRPIIMLLSLLISGYIVAGVRKGT